PGRRRRRPRREGPALPRRRPGRGPPPPALLRPPLGGGALQVYGERPDDGGDEQDGADGDQGDADATAAPAALADRTHLPPELARSDAHGFGQSALFVGHTCRLNPIEPPSHSDCLDFDVAAYRVEVSPINSTTGP